MARAIGNVNSNYLNIGDVSAIDITGTVLTIHAWVRPLSLTGLRKVVSKWTNASQVQHQYSLQLNVGRVEGIIGDAVGDDTATGTTVLPLDGWSSIVMRKNGTGADALAVFLAGVSQDTSTSDRSIQDTTSPLRIFNDNGNSNPLDGSIAEVAIWSVALSDGEIQLLAAGMCPQNVQWPFLVGYWPIRGLESPELDMSQNNNVASIVGTVTPSSHPAVSCEELAGLGFVHTGRGVAW
jgi:Concanavalin A-like lectin/glucanases superfamily